jgi:DNA-binding CsgD family transcriptional regulator
MEIVTKKVVIVDQRLESLVYGQNFDGIGWVLARDENEIREWMRIGSCRKVLLHQRFRFDRKGSHRVSGSKPPIVLVFEREDRPPSLRTILPLLPRLDMIIARSEIEASLREVISAVPFFSSWSRNWPSHYPDEMGEIYRIYQKLKSTRDELSSQQWDVLRHWAGSGEVSKIARDLGRHPQTIRNHLRAISDHLGVKDVDQFMRHSTRAILRLVDSMEPWQKEQ